MALITHYAMKITEVCLPNYKNRITTMKEPPGKNTCSRILYKAISELAYYIMCNSVSETSCNPWPVFKSFIFTATSDEQVVTSNDATGRSYNFVTQNEALLYRRLIKKPPLVAPLNITSSLAIMKSTNFKAT